jgi:DNA-binding beta-propeller fold protein YncE
MHVRLISLLAVSLLSLPAPAADLIVSANDGKYVRVEGASTYPQPAPSDSVAVIDASQFPPVVKAIVEGVEHTIAGPPQAVAITPDGKLAIIGAPSKYDYAAGKESFGTFLQVVDLEASPPKILERVDIAAHPNGLSISPDGTLLLAATLDGTLKVVTISGKQVTLADSIKVGDKRLSGVSFTHDGKSALVAQRDEGGLAVLDVDGSKVTLSKERVSTGIAPYGIDVSSDGKWAVVGNAGLAGLIGRLAPGDVDLVTLVDVSKRPFRAVQHVTIPSVPEGVALSPDGNWIAVQSLNGSNLTPSDPGPGRQKLGRVTLFAINDGVATRVNDVAGGEAAQGIVFAKDNKTILVQFDVERQIAVYQIRDGKLIDTGERLKLDAGPVSIRSMPR